MMLQKTILGVVAISLAALACRASAQESGPTKVSYRKYQVLYTDNMFLRNRKAGAVATDTAPAPAAGPLSPEENLVVRGIACEGEGPNAAYYVFVEDLGAQTTTKVRVGDAVGQGRLTRATLDSVEYVKGGKAIKLVPGQNLTGADAASADAAAAAPGIPPASTSQPAAAPAARSSPPLSEEAIKEKLRLQRLKEMAR